MMDTRPGDGERPRAGAAPEPASSLRDRLIGAWTLQSYIAFPVDGSPPFHPLGEDARGLILYTPDGYMSAQLMRVGRPAFASGDWFVGTHQEFEKAAAYVAYSGRFHVDEAGGTVTHDVGLSFFPNWLGQAQIRSAELAGDVLRLTPAAPIQSGGVNTTSCLTLAARKILRAATNVTQVRAGLGDPQANRSARVASIVVRRRAAYWPSAATPSASFEQTWFVKDFCGTPAASATSRAPVAST